MGLFGAWLVVTNAVAFPGIIAGIARIALVSENIVRIARNANPLAKPSCCNNLVSACRPRFRPSTGRAIRRKTQTVEKAENRKD